MTHQPTDKASVGEEEALEKQMGLFRHFVIDQIDRTVPELAKQKDKETQL